MGPIGLPEMMALFVIALLLFGPKKLPELGKTLGKGLSEFRRAKNELKATLESHMNEIEKETRLESASSNTTTDSSHYTYPYDDYNNYGSDYHSPDRQLTGEQQAAVEANAAAADPAAHGVAAIDEAGAATHTNPQVAGTIPRTNGVQPLHSNGNADHHAQTNESAHGLDHESTSEAVEERHS